MAIHRVGPDDIENFTLQLNPQRTFISSSAGITGSVPLFARSSPAEKDPVKTSLFNETTHDENDIQNILEDTKRFAHSSLALSTNVNIYNRMIAYLSGVNATARSARKQTTLDIIRFEPSFAYTSDTQRKNVVRNVLYPYYRHTYPGASWAYTNYNTLNFFTASSVPSNTVLLYPNSSSVQSSTSTSGCYVLDDAFTFEFYINPRYTTDGPFDSFRAGTLFHLSSSYAVSIITGSSRDQYGLPDGYRILLQLSGGADIAPSSATSSTQRTFMSNDNALRRNHWHHVGVRWSARINSGTGSFIVDAANAGDFIFPSSSIRSAVFTSSSNPSVLCVGNFYEGNNAGSNSTSLFFNQNISRREGLSQLVNDGDITTNTPSSFTFRHPLNAEVHELKIHPRFLSINELSASMTAGPTETGSMLFYVPPFFTRESPNRSPYGSNALGQLIGGVMQTPFQSITGSTVDPFNVALSFGIGARLMNLENFTRDFATKNYPRLLHLSASEIGTTVSTALSANSLLYDEQTNFFSGSIRKRNLTILPNDNGRFYPNFGLLGSGTLDMNPASGSNHDRYTNDLGNLDLSIISLSDMVPTGSLYTGLGNIQSGAIFSGIAGASPESIGVAPGEVLTIFQRTRDPSSNEVVFFDISNLFYGLRIIPGSLSVRDISLSGSNGKLSVVVKDNGFGGLYRADCATQHATWNNVGDIFYNEGIAVIKNPSLIFFGKDYFRVDMTGEQNVHIMRINTLARAGEINSSSNPTFEMLSASLLAHETDAKFVYIDTINFHDDNLNVVMKTKLAQPIIKRVSDRYMFKTRYDF